MLGFFFVFVCFFFFSNKVLIFFLTLKRICLCEEIKKIVIWITGLYDEGYQVYIFLVSPQKHMLWQIWVPLEVPS